MMSFIVYSLFVENGVIVCSLSYRPWQEVYSISGCKVFLVFFFYKLIEVRKNMKLIDVDSKATLGDFLTLKKTELVVSTEM
jgi:hypothetical protein